MLSAPPARDLMAAQPASVGALQEQQLPEAQVVSGDGVRKLPGATQATTKPIPTVDGVQTSWMRMVVSFSEGCFVPGSTSASRRAAASKLVADLNVPLVCAVRTGAA